MTKKKSLKEYSSFIEGLHSKAPPHYLQVSDGTISGFIDPHEYYETNQIPNKVILSINNDYYFHNKKIDEITRDDLKNITEMYIYLEIKPTYGRRRIVPLCEKSKLLAKLCRIDSFRDGIGKTIPYEAIPLIEKLGYNIKWSGLTTEDRNKLEELQQK